jgi:hypothetical protein
MYISVFGIMDPEEGATTPEARDEASRKDDRPQSRLVCLLRHHAHHTHARKKFGIG